MSNARSLNQPEIFERIGVRLAPEGDSSDILHPHDPTTCIQRPAFGSRQPASSLVA